jgi:glycosyltransferase involved in cell wall biosynthesis
MFLGVKDDVSELYQAMDIFVLPSLYEGLGFVRVKALAAGCPVIVSDMCPPLCEFGKAKSADPFDERFLSIGKEDIPPK